MTDSDADDLRLVAELCRGETAAAHELYRRHGTALLRFGMALMGHRPTAEDMVHDTFVEFLRRPRQFDPASGALAAYLFGIARHRAARIARQPVPEELTDAAPVESAADTAEEYERVRTIERVRRAVLELPFAEREVVALCDLEELPYATVATILGCPIGTVRSRLHRARERLAARMAGDLGRESTDAEPARAMISLAAIRSWP